MRKTVVFDFDGVIHKGYSGYKDGSIYGEIDDDLLDFIYELMENFYIVISSNRDADQIVDFLNGYQNKILFKRFDKDKDNLYWKDKNAVGVTNQKAIGILYIDDRGYRYNSKNSSKCINEIKNILYDQYEKSVRPAVEKLLEEADQAAMGTGEFYTYKDAFCEE